MNLIGRDRELTVVREHLRAGRNLVVCGAEGAGKSALVQEAIRDWPGAVYCADSATLKTACESLLTALKLTVSVADNIARKRAILRATAGKKCVFVFDHVGWVSPKLLSFLENIHDAHPMIIVTRSLAWKEIGHLKLILYDFDTLELPPLSHDAMLELSRARLGVRESSFERDLMRLAHGNPGRLVALCEQARLGDYNSAQLLDLDQRIANLRLGR